MRCNATQRGTVSSRPPRTFSERGFGGASTREIAARAGVNQGLITYYFQSKQDLWKAAVDRIFQRLRLSFEGFPDTDDSVDPHARARETIRAYVRFVATHPELFRLMVEEGKSADARLRWLVDAHLKAIYAGFVRLVERYNPGLDRGLIPHLYYTLAGAGSMIFALRSECRRLTGLDPAGKEAIETHAEFVAQLLIP